MSYRIKNTRIKTQFALRNEPKDYGDITYLKDIKNSFSNQNYQQNHTYFQQLSANDLPNSYESSKQLQMPIGINNSSNRIRNNYEAEDFSQVKKNQLFLDRVLKAIQKQSNYDQIQQHQIAQERSQLKALIKQINQKLNSYILSTKNDYKRNQHHYSNSNNLISDRNAGNNPPRHLKLKTSMAQATELKYQSILQQIHNNYKLLSIMKNQHHFLSQRIKHISDPFGKLSVQSKIAQILMQIKIVKSQITVIKSKKIQNQKIFIKGNKKSSVLLNQLQEENMNLLRRIQTLQGKNQQVQIEQTKLQNLSRTADQQYSFLKELVEAKGLKSNKNSSKVLLEHQKLIYQTNKRKLQLALRKSERDQQNFKKRYFQLLSSLDKCSQNQNKNQQKIIQIQAKIQYLNQKMSFIKEKLKDSNHQNHNQERIKKSVSSFQNSQFRDHHNLKQSQAQSDQEDLYGDSNFMLTQIQETKKIKRKKSTKSNQKHQFVQNIQFSSYNPNSYENSQSNSQIKQLKNVQGHKYSKNIEKQKYRRLFNLNPNLFSSKSSQIQKYEKANKSLGQLNNHGLKDFDKQLKDKNTQNGRYSSSHMTPQTKGKNYARQRMESPQTKIQIQPQKYTESEKEVQQISQDQKVILQRLLDKNIKQRQTKLKDNLFRNPLQKYQGFQQLSMKSLNMCEPHVPKLKTVIVSDKQKKKQAERNQYLKQSSLKYQQIEQQIEYESIVQSIAPSARKLGYKNTQEVQQQIEQLKQ